MYKDKYGFLGIDMEATGKRICELIDSSPFNDKDIAGFMGISVQAINKWRHNRNLPDIENLYILSKILRVKIDDIIIPRKYNLNNFEEVKKFFYYRMWIYYTGLANCKS